MAHMQGTETVADPVAQLRKFLTLRVVVATLLLGAGAVLYFKHGAREQAFFLLAVTAIVYFHTFFYHLLLRRFGGWLRPLKAALLVFDMVAASAVVAETGGQASPYIFLFAILILVGSVMFSKAVSYLTAAVTWLLYLGIIAYQLHTEQSPVEMAGAAAGPWFDVRLLYTMLTLVGFIIIATLGSYLSELSRATHRELRVQSESLRTLRNLHENIAKPDVRVLRGGVANKRHVMIRLPPTRHASSCRKTPSAFRQTPCWHAESKGICNAPRSIRRRRERVDSFMSERVASSEYLLPLGSDRGVSGDVQLGGF